MQAPPLPGNEVPNDTRPATNSDQPQSEPSPPPLEKKQSVERVEVKAQRTSTTDERRESAAAKIIVGRDEIEKFGDSALVDVLRRLPGVTVNNSGAVSLRGMGAQFTQILIDGERVAPGFSIEQLAPDQVERIEIFRAPTAETGARAIAGTINIILRKPRAKKEDDLKLGARSINGKVGENVSLSRNDALSTKGTYNITITARDLPGAGNRSGRATIGSGVNATLASDQREFSDYGNRSSGATLSAQLQWKWADGEQFILQPFFSKGRFVSTAFNTLVETVSSATPPYATSVGFYKVNADVARVATTLNKRIDETTMLELRAGTGRVRRDISTADNTLDANRLRVLSQTSENQSGDVSWNASAKLIRSSSETSKFVAGTEIESVKRVDQIRLLSNGLPRLAQFGSEFNISTLRRALYAQHEWDPAANWSANIGARWEGFETRSNADTLGSGALRNSSSVFTPLAHVVWRFNKPKNDQIRLSLTQSYQTPAPNSLIPRPQLDATYPVPGPNLPSHPDYAGNPNQRPERANGLDLAFERYTAGGGVVSVNFFTRHIRDLRRDVILLENVSWADSPRYVARPRNFGRAVSRGLEFDAKIKLTEMIGQAPPLDLRANLSLFESTVDSVQGPNNRIGSQPRAKANVGLDYRFTRLPVALGMSVSYTPAGTVKSTNFKQDFIAANRVIDVYALWTISPKSKLRLTLSNLLPKAQPYTSSFLTDNQRYSTTYQDSNHPTIALQWDVRL